MVSVYRSVHCLNGTYIVVWTRKIFKSIGMFCHFFEKKKLLLPVLRVQGQNFPLISPLIYFLSIKSLLNCLNVPILPPGCNSGYWVPQYPKPNSKVLIPYSFYPFPSFSGKMSTEMERFRASKNQGFLTLLPTVVGSGIRHYGQSLYFWTWSLKCAT